VEARARSGAPGVEVPPPRYTRGYGAIFAEHSLRAERRLAISRSSRPRRGGGAGHLLAVRNRRMKIRAAVLDAMGALRTYAKSAPPHDRLWS